MNTINLMGRLTRDPEIRYTTGKDPVAVAKFTLAVRRNQEQTDFIDCEAWAGTAEMVEKYFSKGMMMAVTGSLQIDNWETKEGEKRRSAVVNVRSSYFCESKKDKEPEPEPEKKPKYNNRR